MAPPCEESESSRHLKPKQVAPAESGSNAALRDFVERAGAAYFKACHRMARAITHFKGRRNKR